MDKIALQFTQNSKKQFTQNTKKPGGQRRGSKSQFFQQEVTFVRVNFHWKQKGKERNG